MAQQGLPREVAMSVAFGCGAVGVCGLVTGSVLLVWETRPTLAILAEETELALRGLDVEARTCGFHPKVR